MSVWQGDVYAASYTAPVVATVVLTVTAPDGTTSTPAVVTSAAPTYTSTVPTPLIGTYLLVWSASGAVVDVFVDQFSVVAPSLALISFSELKDQLNSPLNDTTGDAKLRRFMQSAADEVEYITGPMRGQARTEFFDGARSSIVLSPRWIQSITTITETLGTTTFTLTEQVLSAGGFTQYGYTWDKNTNNIIRRYNGITGYFPAGDANVAVTYKQGISPLPQTITDAAGELIRHWWQNGQQPRSISWSSPGTDDDTEVIAGLTYWIPNRVVEMLSAFARGPSSA